MHDIANAHDFLEVPESIRLLIVILVTVLLALFVVASNAVGLHVLLGVLSVVASRDVKIVAFRFEFIADVRSFRHGFWHGRYSGLCSGLLLLVC
jgi:hypothetical protein